MTSMRQLNSAYLMKLGWRLKSEPASLWARILKEKYGPRGRGTLRESATYSCSHTWRGIKENMDFTNQGIGFAIGDGRQTMFWKQRWLHGGVLEDKAIRAIPEDH